MCWPAWWAPTWQAEQVQRMLLVRPYLPMAALQTSGPATGP